MADIYDDEPRHMRQERSYMTTADERSAIATAIANEAMRTQSAHEATRYGKYHFPSTDFLVERSEDSVAVTLLDTGESVTIRRCEYASPFGKRCIYSDRKHSRHSWEWS